jgi:hypothetical protein
MYVYISNSVLNPIKKKIETKKHKRSLRPGLGTYITYVLVYATVRVTQMCIPSPTLDQLYTI